jgi:hypothetical protein
MKVRLFVSSMAALLAVWLGVTFVRDVPWQAYPVLGKGGIPMAARKKDQATTGQLVPLATKAEVTIAARAE